MWTKTSLPPIIRLDEAEAFLAIEPLHGSLRHLAFLSVKHDGEGRQVDCRQHGGEPEANTIFQESDGGRHERLSGTHPVAPELAGIVALFRLP
jgi:hypothetical protein